MTNDCLRAAYGYMDASAFLGFLGTSAEPPCRKGSAN